MAVFTNNTGFGSPARPEPRTVTYNQDGPTEAQFRSARLGSRVIAQTLGVAAWLLAGVALLMSWSFAASLAVTWGEVLKLCAVATGLVAAMVGLPVASAMMSRSYPQESRWAVRAWLVALLAVSAAAMVFTWRLETPGEKFDGYRLQAHIRSDRVKLLTRSGLDWTAKLGAAIAVALADLPVTDAIIDGEIVAENAAGAADFSALQDALSTGRTERLAFYAFDHLYLNGFDLRPAPLVVRKTALEAIIIAPGAVRYSEHFEEDGPHLLGHVCRLGLEGVVSKVRNAPYRSGRIKGWTKSKCANRQEFVVAGYVPSTVPARQSAR